MNKSYRYLGFLLLGFCCLVFANNDSDSNKNFSTSFNSLNVQSKNIKTGFSTFVIMIHLENAENMNKDIFLVIEAISKDKNEGYVLVDTKEVTPQTIASSYNNYQSSSLFCIDASSWVKLNLEDHSISKREGRRAFILSANNKIGFSHESGRYLGFPPFPMPFPIFAQNSRQFISLDDISSDSQNQSLVGYDGSDYRIISVEEYRRLKDSAWDPSQYFSETPPLEFKSAKDSLTYQDMHAIGFDNSTITECKNVNSVNKIMPQNIKQDIQGN